MALRAGVSGVPGLPDVPPSIGSRTPLTDWGSSEAGHRSPVIAISPAYV